MTRPRLRRPPREPDPTQDPTHPDYIHPAEERRLRRALRQRVDYLFDLATSKGFPDPDS